MRDFYFRLYTKDKRAYSCRAPSLMDAAAQCDGVITKHQKYETAEQLFAFMDKEKVCESPTR